MFFNIWQNTYSAGEIELRRTKSRDGSTPVFTPARSVFRIVLLASRGASGVLFLVTTSAERDEVPLGIVSQPAPGLDVMNVEVLGRSAVLASPAVPREHLFSKFLVSVPIESKAGPSLAQRGHEAFRNPSRNVTFMALGSSSNIRLIDSSKLSFSLLS